METGGGKESENEVKQNLVHGSRPKTSEELGADVFVDSFFSKSRLHYLGTWKVRYEEFLGTIDQDIYHNSNHASAGERFSQHSSSSLVKQKIVFHVDMDAFFCTVSSLSKSKEFREMNYPCAVSWPGGEISSCNYKAREFGVKAGMSGRHAKDLCPGLQTLDFDFEKYSNVAEDVYRELFRVSPKVIGVSVDEAFVDVTAAVQQMVSSSTTEKQAAMELAQTIRKNIHTITKGCTASIGIGPNRLVARFATKRAKPDGVFYIQGADEFANIVSTFRVRELPGVGYRTEQKLNELGIHTCQELSQASKSFLESSFGEKSGKTLFELAHGIDSRAWEPLPKRKSIGAQISWGVRMSFHHEVKSFVDELSRQIVQRLKQAKKPRGGSSIGLKVWRAVESAPETMRKGTVGHGICTILQRSVKLSEPTGLDSEIITKFAFDMYTALAIEATEVRGMGISVSQLVDGDNDGDHEEGEEGSSKKRKITVKSSARGKISSMAAGRAEVYSEDREFHGPIIKKSSSSHSKPILPIIESTKASSKDIVARTRYHQQQVKQLLSERETEMVSTMAIDEMKNAMKMEIRYCFEFHRPQSQMEQALRDCHRLLRMFNNELQRRNRYDERAALINYCEVSLEFYNPKYLPARCRGSGGGRGDIDKFYSWFRTKVLSRERSHQITASSVISLVDD